MSRTFGTCLTLLFALMLNSVFSGNARATPPRSIHVNDIPIAYNPTHLFILRTVFDNFGSYYIENGTRFLVAQNLTTSVVEKHWFLGRTNLETIEECAPDCLRVELPAKFDVLEALSKVSATPVLVYPILQWNSANLDTGEDEKYPSVANIYSLNAKGIFIYNDNEEKDDILVPTNRLLKIVDHNLTPTFKKMQETGSDTGEAFADELETYARNFEGCAIGTPNHNITGYKLLLLNCESDELVGYYQIYLSMKDPDLD